MHTRPILLDRAAHRARTNPSRRLDRSPAARRRPRRRDTGRHARTPPPSPRRHGRGSTEFDEGGVSVSGMPRTAPDRAPRPKCRSGRAVASNLLEPAGGLSPSDPIPTATGSAAPAPNFLTACRGSSRHKSTAFAGPAAARITLPAQGIGFGEAMERDEGMAAAAAAAGAGAGAQAARWETSPDGVIVLPVGSAAPRPPPPHARQQRERERETEREREREQHNNPGAGVFGEQPHPELPEKVFYKTKLCEKFEAGKCAYEDGCTFAHGEAELRPPMFVPPALVLHRRKTPPPPPPPPAVAEPPFGGYYGGKVCFEFRDRGTCHYGDRCNYAHATAAEVAGTCALELALYVCMEADRARISRIAP